MERRCSLTAAVDGGDRVSWTRSFEVDAAASADCSIKVSDVGCCGRRKRVVRREGETMRYRSYHIVISRLERWAWEWDTQKHMCPVHVHVQLLAGLDEVQGQFCLPTL